MLGHEITEGLELKRIQRGAGMEGTGGHNWKVGVKHEVQTHADTAVNL